MNKVTDEKRRTKNLQIRLRASEREELEKKAKFFGLTLAQYVRMKLFGEK